MRTGMRSGYFWRMRSASPFLFSVTTGQSWPYNRAVGIHTKGVLILELGAHSRDRWLEVEVDVARELVAVEGREPRGLFRSRPSPLPGHSLLFSIPPELPLVTRAALCAQLTQPGGLILRLMQTQTRTQWNSRGCLESCVCVALDARAGLEVAVQAGVNVAYLRCWHLHVFDQLSVWAICSPHSSCPKLQRSCGVRAQTARRQVPSR